MQTRNAADLQLQLFAGEAGCYRDGQNCMDAVYSAKQITAMGAARRAQWL